jgi:hypothetical protein
LHVFIWDTGLEFDRSKTVKMKNSTFLFPSSDLEYHFEFCTCTYIESQEKLRWRCVFFLLLFLVGWDWVSWYCGHYWPIVPAPDDRWWWLWRNWWDEEWQGKPKYSEKTCPSAILSTTNPTWLDPGLNPGRRSGSQRLTAWAMARPHYLLTYGAESLLRSCQLCSHSGTSQHFEEPECSPCSQEPSTGPFLSQIDPVRINPFNLSKIYFNIVYPPTSWSS